MNTPEKANIPKRFITKTIDDYEVNPRVGDEDVIDLVETYIKDLAQHIEDGRGLLFLGPSGTGKTMLSCLVGLSALNKGFSCFYTTVSGYVRTCLQVMSLQDAWKTHPNDVDSKAEWAVKTKLLKDIRNVVSVLILDDVGKEHTTSTRFAEDEIDFLLRYRFDKGLPTIMSSNYPVKEWADMYGDSMESFIHEAFYLVTMATKDYRRESTKST